MDWLDSDDIQTYETARILSEEESKKDPQTEPFKSKYKAREILHELKNKIEHLIEDQEIEDLKLLTAGLLFHLGINYVETEEISSGEEHLRKCDSILKPYKLNPKCISIVTSTLNQLGIIWSSRSESNAALEFLKESEESYKRYKHECSRSPWGIHEIFQDESQHRTDHERNLDLEKIYTHTLYYLAQVYGNLGEKTKSAKLCHITLRRQLETKQYSPMDWALNCVTLSQYYLAEDYYTLSRHCLASATRVFEEVLEANAEKMSEADAAEDGDVDEIKHRKADISRCWSKYCIALLQYSKAKIEEQQRNSRSIDSNSELLEGESAAEASQDSNNEGSSVDGEEKHMERFESLELTSIEDQVTDSPVESFEKAREVFLAGQKYLSESKEYYVMDGHVSDYIEIIKDHSQLFRLLSFFETDVDRQCKMHKRRIDMLTEINDELNPQYFIHVQRQLIYEIAETYSEIMDLKIKKLNSSEDNPTAHAVQKINTLVTQSIGFFQKFLDTLKGTDDKMPEKFEEDLVRPTLVAYFCMGRLYSKLIAVIPQQRLANLDMSLKHYNHVTDYCEKYPDACKLVQDELEICREMVHLLPLRMESIKRSGEEG